MYICRQSEDEGWEWPLQYECIILWLEINFWLKWLPVINPFKFVETDFMEDPMNGNGSNSSTTSFTPAFLKNPSFHYSNKTLYSFDTSSQVKTDTSLLKATDETTETLLNPKRIKFLDKHIERDIVTVRFKASTDEDFVEIDLDKANTTFEEFKELIYKELNHIDKNLCISKIRKLPNVLVRNTSDIRRLKEEQEIVVFFAWIRPRILAPIFKKKYDDSNNFAWVSYIFVTFDFVRTKFAYHPHTKYQIYREGKSVTLIFSAKLAEF